MANKFCTQCGAPGTAGKRFCNQCGHEFTEVEVSVQSSHFTTVTKPAALADAPTLPPRVESSPVTFDKAQHPNDAAVKIGNPPSQIQDKSVPTGTNITLDLTKPVQKKFPALPLVLATVAACTLAAAGIAMWMHTSRAKNTAGPSSNSPSTTGTASQRTTSVANSDVATREKPGAGAAAKGEVEISESSAQAQKTVAANRPSLPEENGVPRIKQTKTSTESAEGPAYPNSGTLHYEGPPVHYLQSISFTHLPAGRLKFTFDHQAWQPLISRQSDGTQTLSLRSLKQNEQLRCDVGWEIIK